MPEVGMMPFGEMGMPGGQHIFHHHIFHFPNQFNPFGFGFNPFMFRNQQQPMFGGSPFMGQ